MAVADLVLNGFEMALTRATIVGNAAVSTTNPRTGTYSLRTNPSASTSTAAFKTFAATGLIGTNLGRTAETFYTVYIRITTLPGSSTIGIMGVQASAGTSVVRVDMTTGGALTLVGTSTSATVATLSTGTWYRLDLRVTSNGTSGLKIDGGSETTITANNVTQDQLVLGVMTSETADIHWDDMVIGTTSPGGAVEIKRIGPTAIGSQTSGWTGGTATGGDYVHVDEVSQDGDTTYWGASGSTTARRTVALENCATVSITGTVHAVLGLAVVRDEGGSSGMGVTMRNGSTNSDKTSLDPGSAYTALCHLRTTDPNGGGAWTTSGVDSLEVGVYANDITAVRCTMLAAEVAYTPAAGGTTSRGPLVNAGLINRGLVNGGGVNG